MFWWFWPRAVDPLKIGIDVMLLKRRFISTTPPREQLLRDQNPLDCISVNNGYVFGLNAFFFRLFEWHTRSEQVLSIYHLVSGSTESFTILSNDESINVYQCLLDQQRADMLRSSSRSQESRLFA